MVKKNVKYFLLVLLGVVAIAVLTQQLTITSEYEFSPDNPTITQGETQTFQAKLLIAPYNSMVYYEWRVDGEPMHAETINSYEYSTYTTPPSLTVGSYTVEVGMLVYSEMITAVAYTTLTVTSEPQPTPTPTGSPYPTPTPSPSPTTSPYPSPTPTGSPTPIPTVQPTPPPDSESALVYGVVAVVVVSVGAFSLGVYARRRRRK